MDVRRVRARARFAAGLLICQMALCASALIGQTRASTTDAHPIDVPVTTIIEFGDQYLGGDELYDAKITVLQVARGEKAWGIVKEASTSNPLPKPGYEYLLARVRFEFAARTSPSHYNYSIDGSQFVATATDGQEYESPSLAEQPKPSLTGTIKPGDSLEGWVVLLVPRKDDRPLMVFREDVGSVIHRGGGTWFQLYGRGAANGPAKTQ
jgi:hypothetical protein